MAYESYRMDSARGGGSASDRSDDPDAIRREIEETRARISRDLDAIGERLNPHYMKEQVKENIREATIGRVENMAKGAAGRVNDARRGIMETVKENPFPAALAAIGIGWLYVNGRRQDGGMQSRGDSGYSRERSGYGSLSAYSPPGGGFYARGGFEESGEQGHGPMERVKEGASAVGENVREAGHALKEKAGDLAEGAQNVAHRAVQMERQQVRRLEDMFFDNPLAIGAATIAVGLAAGLAAPRTHVETKLVGSTRDQVVDRVGEIASETVDKAHNAVDRAIEEHGPGAQQQGEVGAR